MSSHPPVLCLLPVLLLAAPAGAAEEGWTQVSGPPLVMRTRERAGSPAREVWVETELAASAWDIQQTLLQPVRFPRFMPYVKEARPSGAPDVDGGQHVYNLVALPLLGERDYVLKTYCDERVDAEGRGAFRQRWVAVPDALPPRQGIHRLVTNEGQWHVRALGPGRAHVVYRFLVAPGGFVPGFAVDLANRSGVPGTLRAVEQEAQRRAAERRAADGREPESALQECLPQRTAAVPDGGVPAASAPPGG